MHCTGRTDTIICGSDINTTSSCTTVQTLEDTKMTLTTTRSSCRLLFMPWGVDLGVGSLTIRAMPSKALYEEPNLLLYLGK